MNNIKLAILTTLISLCNYSYCQNYNYPFNYMYDYSMNEMIINNNNYSALSSTIFKYQPFIKAQNIKRVIYTNKHAKSYFNYDKTGVLISRIDTLSDDRIEKMEFKYDNNRLVSIISNISHIVKYKYDNNLDLINIIVLENSTDTVENYNYYYDSSNRVKKISLQKKNKKYIWEYEYKTTSINEFINGELKTTYIYDANNVLIQKVRNNYSIKYSYGDCFVLWNWVYPTSDDLGVSLYYLKNGKIDNYYYLRKREDNESKVIKTYRFNGDLLKEVQSEDIDFNILNNNTNTYQYEYY